MHRTPRCHTEGLSIRLMPPASSSLSGDRLISVCFLIGLIIALTGKALAAEPVPPFVLQLARQPDAFRGQADKTRPIPTFNAAELPAPIIADHKGWVHLYWKAWRLAWKHLKEPTHANGFRGYYISPAFDGHIFQWDTCFILQYARYAYPYLNDIRSLDNFYVHQHKSGYICREITENRGRDYWPSTSPSSINPPLFSWAEWRWYQFTGNDSRFAKVLPVLTHYYLWLRLHRRRPDGCYWNDGLGSGCDDTVIQGRAYGWVDMTSQQALDALYMAKIAAKVGRRRVAHWFRRQYVRLKQLVNRLMWDPRVGFYYPISRAGHWIEAKSTLSFWPLLAGIASQRQAAEMVRHLTEVKEFWRPDVVPTLAYNAIGYNADGQYWRGAVWAPTNYMVACGLARYGYYGLARRIAVRYLDNMSAVLHRTGTIWENYAPEYAAGFGKPNMVGWSGVGPIAMLIENILGITVDAPDEKVIWRPRLQQKNGIKRLMVGDTRLYLVAGPVHDGRRTLYASSDGPLELQINLSHPKRTHLIELMGG